MNKIIGLLAVFIFALLAGYSAGHYQASQSQQELITTETKKLNELIIAKRQEIAELTVKLEAAQAELKKQQTVAKPATPTVQPTSHTVVKGDTLSKIAKQVYSDEGKWGKLFKLNEDKINDPDLIFPGQVLRL